VNNEFTYSNRGKPLSGKTFTFRAKPEMAANLSVLSRDIVSLANNHVYDYGEAALTDTLDTLKQYKVPYVGAGRNLAEAQEIVYFRV
ncbi:CapA family protein, partial [Klebsiella oxytoca]